MTVRIMSKATIGVVVTFVLATSAHANKPAAAKQSETSKPSAGAAQTNKPAKTTKSAGKVCELRINSNDMMQFDKKKLTVAATCQRVRLVLHHTGKLPKAAMGHNWVLTKAADKTAVVAAGVSAGLKNGYLLPDDKRIIAKTTMIGGGEKTTVEFSLAGLQAQESYNYFCTFPGHVGLMTGEFIIIK
ncbi:MAG: azurin [Pseudomonadota bacterium]|nr:azurin [Pseudomonadota bacterium]